MEAHFHPASLLRHIVDFIRLRAPEGNLECQESGLHFNAMDSAHISLISLHLAAEKFLVYKCTQPQVLGIQLESLSGLLSLAGDDDTVKLSAEPEGDQLHIVLEDPQLARTHTISLRLMHIEGEALSPPEIEYPCVVRWSAKEFHKLMQKLKPCGSVIDISVSEEGVEFQVEGDLGRVNSHWRNAPYLHELRIDGGLSKVTISLSLSHVYDFSRGHTLAQESTLSLIPDAPMRLQYQLPEERGTVQLFIAPRIPDSDAMKS